MTIDIPVEDGPAFVSHVEFSRAEDGLLQLRIVKTSGEDYGRILIADDRMQKIIDLL